MAVEYACKGGQTERVFATLAARSGFTEAECALAARTNRLGIIVRLAQLRSKRRAEAAGSRLSGSQALARLRGLEARWRE